jgi:hypothetical protein
MALPLWAKPLFRSVPNSIFVLAVSGNVSVAAPATPLRLVMPSAGKVVKVQTYLSTAPLTTAVVVDVNKNGTTIFTTQGNRPSIAASGTTSTLGDPDGDDVCTFEAGDILTIDVDSIGTGTVGANLSVRIDWQPL